MAASVKSGQVTEEFIHIIVTAYFNGMFEVVRHNMDRAAAHRYVKMLNDYHMAGFARCSIPSLESMQAVPCLGTALFDFTES